MHQWKSQAATESSAERSVTGIAGTIKNSQRQQYKTKDQLIEDAKCTLYHHHHHHHHNICNAPITKNKKTDAEQF